MNERGYGVMRRLASVAWVLAAVAAVGQAGCGDEDLGAPCRFDEDCGDGFCCTSKDCARGMCTFPCRDDRDCPGDMSCHGQDVCLFLCADDRDCPPGFDCKDKGPRRLCVGD